jgi:hypothetical protein
VVASGPDSQNGRGEGVGGVARHIELRRRGGGGFRQPTVAEAGAES